jgi:hypothetical protein
VFVDDAAYSSSEEVHINVPCSPTFDVRPFRNLHSFKKQEICALDGHHFQFSISKTQIHHEVLFSALIGRFSCRINLVSSHSSVHTECGSFSSLRRQQRPSSDWAGFAKSARHRRNCNAHSPIGLRLDLTLPARPMVGSKIKTAQIEVE